MLRIGDFSRLGNVTIVTLRHYDQLGLLKPDKVDPETGYRYYSAAQLPRLNRILLLKDLGFNLEQIARLLDQNLPVEQMVGMLKLRQAEVEQLVTAEQARLARIEARLNHIQQEDNLPEYDLIIKKIEPLRVLSIRDKIDTYPQARLLLRELKAHLQRYGLEWSYPNLTIWQEIEYLEHDIEVEAAVPLESKLPTTPRIGLRTLPEIEMAACAIHQGDYDTLTRAYEAAIKWCEANNFRLGAPFREVYLHYEKGNPQADITEIQIPIEQL